MQWTVISWQLRNTPSETGVVTFARFDIVEVSGEVSSMVQYGVELLPPTGTFIPLDQVTNEVAVSWVQDALGPVRVAEMEAEVLALLEQRKHAKPPEVPSWVPSIEPPKES